MLDICIPLSEDTNGIISAMNGSCISSVISSWRSRSPPLSKSGTDTSSARARRSKDESVGVAFSFSIFGGNERYVVLCRKHFSAALRTGTCPDWRSGSR